MLPLLKREIKICFLNDTVIHYYDLNYLKVKFILLFFILEYGYQNVNYVSAKTWRENIGEKKVREIKDA